VSRVACAWGWCITMGADGEGLVLCCTALSGNVKACAPTAP
jgi:hypothetical protein